MKHVSSFVLEKFASWFSSAAGAWQTVLVVLGWVALEYLGVVHDTNMFQLMVWLTIYSGMTQNILAYVSKMSAVKWEEVMDRVADLGVVDVKLDSESYELLKALALKLDVQWSVPDAMGGQTEES